MYINYNEIDVEMRPIIKTLNDKGWTTKYCCQGHWNEKLNCYFGSYLGFNVKVPKEYFPQLPTFPFKDDDRYISSYKSPITVVGCGYKNKIKNMEYNNTFYWRNSQYKRMSREEKDREHEQFIKELTEWANGLPNYMEIDNCETRDARSQS